MNAKIIVLLSTILLTACGGEIKLSGESADFFEPITDSTCANDQTGCEDDPVVTDISNDLLKGLLNQTFTGDVTVRFERLKSNKIRMVRLCHESTKRCSELGFASHTEVLILDTSKTDDTFVTQLGDGNIAKTYMPNESNNQLSFLSNIRDSNDKLLAQTSIEFIYSDSYLPCYDSQYPNSIAMNINITKVTPGGYETFYYCVNLRKSN